MTPNTLPERTPIAAGDPSFSRQIPPVGRTPDLTHLFIGSLLYSTADEVLDVAAHVVADDLDEPAATMFRAAIELASNGVQSSPQVLASELLRQGLLDRSKAAWLTSAAVSGACASAARHYATGIVANSVRRQAESHGHALVLAAESEPESLLQTLAERAAEQIRCTIARLHVLRGDHE